MKVNRTVFRTTQILSLLSKSREGMTISAISEALSMPQASTHDIVKTLSRAHFLQEHSRRYTVGFAVKEVGEAYEQGKDLLSIAKKHVKGPAESFFMNGALVMLRGYELDYAMEYRPKGSIVAPGEGVGGNIMHASASGKVHLAFSSPAKQQKLLKSLCYIRFTAHTIYEESVLLQELEKVKETGYAVDRQEFHDVLTCVSAPIMVKNSLLAAITLSGIGVNPANISLLGETVKSLAYSIAEEVSATSGV